MLSKKILITVDKDLQDLIPGFIERRKSEVSVLRNSLDAKDFTALQTFGHRIKGNAGGYGFDALGLLGSSLEESALLHDKERIKTIIDEIESYLSAVELVYDNAS